MTAAERHPEILSALVKARAQDRDSAVPLTDLPGATSSAMRALMASSLVRARNESMMLRYWLTPAGWRVAS
jgi:hypothetical protein